MVKITAKNPIQNDETYAVRQWLIVVSLIKSSAIL